jgi:phosphatidate cytidylyltransferase
MADAPAPAPAKKPSDLAPRVASALVMVGLALATLWAGGLWFHLFWLAAGAAIVWEFQAMIDAPNRALRVAFGAAALAAAAALTANLAIEWALAAALVGALAAGAAAGRGKGVWAATGVLYACALVMATTLLRDSMFRGFESIVWLFAVVWTTDVMAYFGGRMIGGPKLWPRVSPSKTWSGFVTGVSCGAVAGLAVAPIGSTIPYVAALSLVAAMVSQGGDLFESSVKRRFGVKDSSNLIPGHGGVMDRLDGFLAAAAFAALVAFARAGFASPAAALFSW